MFILLERFWCVIKYYCWYYVFSSFQGMLSASCGNLCFHYSVFVLSYLVSYIYALILFSPKIAAWMLLWCILSLSVSRLHLWSCTHCCVHRIELKLCSSVMKILRNKTEICLNLNVCTCVKCVRAHLGLVFRSQRLRLVCLAGILEQSAVWVDEMNYYDMRTDRNKGISPLSLRPSNPLCIDIDKYGFRGYKCTHGTITLP